MAGYGSEVGGGGGFVRFGQWHSCYGRGVVVPPMGLSWVVVAPMELPEVVSLVLSIVGNSCDMMPRSMHASLLRNSLPVLLDT